jgi:hypothetical protein
VLRRRGCRPARSRASKFDASTGGTFSGVPVAGYIAKYATKSTEAVGGITARIKSESELNGLRCREHARRHITSAWQLGTRPEFDGKRLRRWAHQLGYGGHCFTKSRRFSTTFKALREARAVHAASRAAPPGDAPSKSDHNLVRVGAWRYAGRGYPRAGDALLAASSHARAREQRQAAREARAAA